LQMSNGGRASGHASGSWWWSVIDIQRLSTSIFVLFLMDCLSEIEKKITTNNYYSLLCVSLQTRRAPVPRYLQIALLPPVVEFSSTKNNTKTSITLTKFCRSVMRQRLTLTSPVVSCFDRRTKGPRKLSGRVQWWCKRKSLLTNDKIMLTYKWKLY
jgi:hypothetical protein